MGRDVAARLLTPNDSYRLDPGWALGRSAWSQNHLSLGLPGETIAVWPLLVALISLFKASRLPQARESAHLHILAPFGPTSHHHVNPQSQYSGTVVISHSYIKALSRSLFGIL
jgi:hypothetical protein